MNKEEITKGVWSALKLNDGTYAIKDEESLSKGFSDRIAENICSESDADLICEAGTVFFESGLTPNELLLQRDLLLESLKKAKEVIDNLAIGGDISSVKWRKENVIPIEETLLIIDNFGK